MAQIIVKQVGANYEKDEQSLIKAERIVDLNYYNYGDIIHLIINIGDEDHFISLDLDRREFVEKLGEALTNPED